MTPWLRLAFALVLSGSILLNFFLTGKIFAYYKIINMLRLEPDETSLFNGKEKHSGMKNDGFSIILFGDSRIAYWYPELYFPYCTIVNEGKRGQTTTQLKLRLEKDVLSYEPDVVVIQAGINDLKTIGLFKKQKESIIKNCIANLSYIIERITSENARVIVLTIFPTGKPGLIRTWFWPKDIDEARAKINDTLKIKHSKIINVIDVDSILGGKKYIRAEFKSDMLHINKSGYEKLNQLLQPYMQKLLADQAN
jgi:lysophospholipase L1-like esterase